MHLVLILESAVCESSVTSQRFEQNEYTSSCYQETVSQSNNQILNTSVSILWSVLLILSPAPDV